jgi:hypothetical protein
MEWSRSQANFRRYQQADRNARLQTVANAAVRTIRYVPHSQVKDELIGCTDGKRCPQRKPISRSDVTSSGIEQKLVLARCDTARNQEDEHPCSHPNARTLEMPGHMSEREENQFR